MLLDDGAIVHELTFEEGTSSVEHVAQCAAVQLPHGLMRGGRLLDALENLVPIEDRFAMRCVGGERETQNFLAHAELVVSHFRLDGADLGLVAAQVSPILGRIPPWQVQAQGEHALPHATVPAVLTRLDAEADVGPAQGFGEPGDSLGLGFFLPEHLKARLICRGVGGEGGCKADRRREPRQLDARPRCLQITAQQPIQGRLFGAETAVLGAQRIRAPAPFVLQLQQVRVRTDPGTELLLAQRDQGVQPSDVIGEEAGCPMPERKPQQRPSKIAAELAFAPGGFTSLRLGGRHENVPVQPGPVPQRQHLLNAINQITILAGHTAGRTDQPTQTYAWVFPSPHCFHGQLAGGDA